MEIEKTIKLRVCDQEECEEQSTGQCQVCDADYCFYHKGFVMCSVTTSGGSMANHIYFCEDCKTRAYEVFGEMKNIQSAAKMEKSK